MECFNMKINKKLLLSIAIAIPFLIGCGGKKETSPILTLSAGRGYFLDQTHQTMSLTIQKGTMFYSVLSGIPNPTPLLDYHVFDHWEINNTPVTEDFAIESDITATATYSYVEPIKITYDFNGGTYDGSADPLEITSNRDVKWSDAIKPDTSKIASEDPLEEFDCWSFNPIEKYSISEIDSFSENTIVYAIYRPKYLKLTALEADSTVSYVAHEMVDVSGIKYSRTGNDNDWHEWTNGDPITLENEDDFIYVKNDLDSLSLSSKVYFRFILTGSVAASGNTNSMINFSDITKGCFCSMFRNCTNLYAAPSLPALDLRDRCYQDMFRGCTNLIIAPDLPATILDVHCYHSMFIGCSKLAVPPVDLPAKKTASHCYYCMFANCPSLEYSPNILSNTAATNSYASMFANCKSLSSIYLAYPEEFTTAFTSWVSEVNRTGNMYYLGYDMSRGEDAIPDGWFVEPRYKLNLNLKNCTAKTIVNDFHYGETVVVTIVPNEGYILPNEISCSAIGYEYNKETGNIVFKGPSSNAFITVNAIKM